MPNRMLTICLSTFVLVLTLGIDLATALPTVSSSSTLQASGAQDQDDMTFWLHPTDLSQSTIITSDKSANKLFVYDLAGNTLQVIAAQKPGNIDTRYGFPLGGEFVDIVAFNERNTNKIRVYKVDPITRRLEARDDGSIYSGPNYGFSLYKSPKTGRFYAFTGPESSTQVKQFELVDAGNGLVSGVGPLRQLQPPGGTVEGMVADDEEGKLYLAQELGGIWKFDAEPDGATSGAKIASVGDNGLTADVEGVAIYYAANGEGYIIVSSQGNSTFNVYERKSPHNSVGTFTVSGVSYTDGVDVINLPLGSFSQGIFAAHNGRSYPYEVEIVRWEAIAQALNLRIDTQYWDPRRRSSSNTPPVAVDDTAVTDEDRAVSINLLSNDIDADGDPLTVASVTQPSNGSATIKADNTVTYTPAANFRGSDSFTYTVGDGRGGRATATVSVTVNPVNDPPVAANQSVKTGVNTPVTITLQATDPENDRLSYWIVTAPVNGSLSGMAPSLTYTPKAGFSGSDSFTFRASDGVSASNLATASIAVNSLPAGIAADGFESGTYSGGTGWSGSWKYSGEVSILSDTDGPKEGIRHARLRAWSGRLKRSVNLSGATNAHLTFWAKVRAFESSDKALVRVSSDGVNFTTVTTFTSAQSDDVYRYYDMDLSGFALTPTFTIAFEAAMSSTGDSWFLDNIRVTGVR